MDAKTTATPLGLLKEEGLTHLIEVFGSKAELYKGLLYGNVAGSLGETSAIALLIGAAILFVKRYITWHIPFSFIATVGVLAWAFGGDQGLFTGDPLIHILSGGLILGAFFMATDYVTSPMLPRGMIIYGIMIGVITVTIRIFGSYPEGISFAILIMNGFTPLINRYVKPKRFGEEVKNG